MNSPTFSIASTPLTASPHTRQSGCLSRSHRNRMRIVESSSAINIRMATLLSRKRKEPLHSASSTDATFASPQQYNVRLGRVTSGIPRRLRMEHWDHDRDKLISASVQWARRILEKIDAVFQSSMRDGRRGHWIVFDEWLHFQAHVI